LLHGAEQQVWGDAGYVGVQKRPEHQGRAVAWQVALKPGQRRKLAPESAAALAEQRKASVRAKVEHPFLWVKRRFGYATVRYRGLAKNRQRLALLLGLANLMTAEIYLAV
jgi:IS5 family transposase